MSSSEIIKELVGTDALLCITKKVIKKVIRGASNNYILMIHGVKMFYNDNKTLSYIF